MIRIDALGLVVTAALAAAGVLAGCGGGGDPGGGADGPPSKQEFAQSADKICLEVERRVSDLNKVKPQSVADLTRFIERLKDVVNDGVTRLKALERPSGAAGKTALQFTDALDSEYERQVLPALNELQRAVAARDRKALQEASRRLQSTQSQGSDRLATALGATQCASS